MTSYSSRTPSLLFFLLSGATHCGGRALAPHLDHAEPHVLVGREPVEHEDGRFVARPAAEGVAELIVSVAHIADLHAQRPPPVPGGGKHGSQNQSQRAPEEPASGGGLCTSFTSEIQEQRFSSPRPLHSHPWGPLSQAIPESTLREYSGINVSKHTIREGKGDIFLRSMTYNPLLISILVVWIAGQRGWCGSSSWVSGKFKNWLMSGLGR